MKTSSLFLFSILFMAACSSTPKQPPSPAADAKNNAASSSNSASLKSKEPSKTSLSCEKGKDARKAEVLPDGKGCKVEYEKFGKKSILASSMNGNRHCKDSLARIEKNLTAAGFSCK